MQDLTATSEDTAIVEDVYRHGLRVAALASTMCRQLGLEPACADAIHQAAALHDIGKLTMPEQLWQKTDRLDAHERTLVRDHTTRGHAVLRRLDPPLAGMVADVALYHHEAWDGSGYPHSRTGEAIPFAARLVGLCDVYAALREARSYKQPFSHDHATHLILQRDRHARIRQGMFDPRLLAAFVAAARPMDMAFARANSGEAASHLPALRLALQSAARIDMAATALSPPTRRAKGSDAPHRCATSTN